MSKKLYPTQLQLTDLVMLLGGATEYSHLTGAFIWSESSQGHEFWSAKSVRLADGKRLSKKGRKAAAQIVIDAILRDDYHNDRD